MKALADRRTEYDNFLYATVVDGELPISVVSMLSRLSLDPWLEASRLAQLPRNQAIKSLSTNIVQFRCSAISPAQAAALATQLVERLPASETLAVRAVQRENLDFTSMWLIFAIFFGMMAVSQKTPPPRKGTQPQPVASQQSEAPVLRHYGVQKHDPGSIPPIRIQQ